MINLWQLRQRVDSLAQWLEHWFLTPATRVWFPAKAREIFQLCFTLLHTHTHTHTHNHTHTHTHTVLLRRPDTHVYSTDKKYKYPCKLQYWYAVQNLINTVLIIISDTYVSSAGRQFRHTCMQCLYVVHTHINTVLIRSDACVYNAGKLFRHTCIQCWLVRKDTF